MGLLDVLVLVAAPSVGGGHGGGGGMLVQLGLEDEGVDAAEGVVVGGLATEQLPPTGTVRWAIVSLTTL